MTRMRTCDQPIWNDFITSMQEYYRRNYPEGDKFDPNGAAILDENRLYLDDQEVVLDIWFEYRSYDQSSTVYRVVINRLSNRNDAEVYRYDQIHRAKFDIHDSQESHTL